MTARPAALSAQRSAGYAPIQWRATVRSPSRYANCAQTSATGVKNNATRMTWTIASAAQNLAVVALKLAEQWLPDQKVSSTQSLEYEIAVLISEVTSTRTTT